MINKLELISKINIGLDDQLGSLGFHRIKKHNMEYSKIGTSLRQNFSFNIIERYDPKRQSKFFLIEIYFSVFNKEANMILNKAYDLKPPEEFYLLSVNLKKLVVGNSGSEVYSDATTELTYYPDTDIHHFINLLKSTFLEYGLPFYEKFNNLNSIYEELSKSVEFRSIYSDITPSRLLFSFVVSKLIGCNDTKTIMDNYQAYFDNLNNRQLIKVYYNLRNLIW